MITIRDAADADFAAMAELLLIVHRLHVDAHPETYRDVTFDEAVEFLASAIGQPNAYLRVAELESGVHGYCSAVLKSQQAITLLQPRNFVYVNEIVVRPDCRRSGLGRAMIGDLREFARQNDATDIELDVGRFNATARAFFEAHEFVSLRERLCLRVGPSS